MKNLRAHGLKILGAAVCVMMFAATTRARNVSGVIKLDGKRPARKVIKFDADPKCAAMHPKKAGTEQ